jgi:putative transposase
LLANVAIVRPNQAWASDITYLPMAKGFAYLVAILDLCSRKVLSFRVSNSMSTDFCVEALEEALARYGTPEIFNTDQGSQAASGEVGDIGAIDGGIGSATSAAISCWRTSLMSAQRMA